MRGASRLLCLTLFALMLLTVACGVPIPAAEQTATAVADEEARRSESVQGAFSQVSSTRTENAAALSLATTPEAPIETRVSATDTTEPTTEAEDATADEGDDASETPEAADGEEDATPEEGGAEAEATETPTPEPTEPPAPESNLDFAQQFYELLNAQRTGRDIPPLVFNEQIAAAATGYASYMASVPFFGHFGPDGSTPRSRLLSVGYAGQYKGEALSAGQSTPEAALNSLLASSPHAAILLESSAVEVGIGHASFPGSPYGNYWVVMTAVP